MEEHVQGTDERRPLSGGGAGQPDRRSLGRPTKTTQHTAAHPGTGVHRSVSYLLTEQDFYR